MPKFNRLFDKWAQHYDETVYGLDNEYKEVFEEYNKILENICWEITDNKDGLVVEIGVGTGNLTKLLYKKGFRVIGIEPSIEMRKISKSKIPNVEILDGHFLSIPVNKKIDAFVTSYAFHHLTFDEKQKAIMYLDSLLAEDGKIVIADTMFETKEYKQKLYEYVENTKAFNLLKDLNTEYYEYLDDICSLFKNLNYSIKKVKMNKYVWIVTASKGGINDEKSNS